MISLLTVAQIVIPLALLGWLALGRPRTRTSALARTALTAGWLVAIAGAGLWTALPQSIGWAYFVALVAATWLAVRRTREPRWWPGDDGPHPRLARVGTIVVVAAAGGMALFAARTLAWRTPPEGPAVDLAFPLRAGTYLVVNGGSSNVNNGHVGIPDRARDRYRGQTRAVDLIRVDALGRRSDGFAPADPAAYHIFGDTIHAPCAGTVVIASDGLPDLSPPEVDREHMAGNHVVLECDGVWVLLGHMQQGSVQVEPGESVAVGQPLGRVGNTGNSDEPHLHVHAQRPGTLENPFGADPLVIRLDGRYLSRNDRVRAARTPPSTSSAPAARPQG